MIIEEVKKLIPKDRLVYWIQEREAIRLKKEAGAAKPWTDDEILQSYRFCNVRRMDDKVSQWLLKNWYEPNFNHTNMLVASAIARFFNLPSSLEAIGFPKTWQPEKIKEILRKEKEKGPIFNGAYMVRGNDGIDKVECVINYYVRPLVAISISEVNIVDPTSMINTWKNLSECYGFGSFMAGQIVADLRWGIKHQWGEKYTWAPMGPGSQRGMNRLLGNPAKSPMNQKIFNELLVEMRDELLHLLPIKIVMRLEAIDYQNCLCEFDKYSRVLLGEGKPKQLYPGVK